ncbi:response regulator transcription factor [Leifsonia sp. H3M29-4]|uniref:response regulator n=1 Tax=Salinibacterium metalliresistens TaxID=3031321 RepID=UPI0023DA6994|nr:response regulator transcription factor [Salinibacterium metalliresistens]MDF1478339.1 response regulator transcription factor [Salinibacterium metalliresistens]
MSQEQDIRVVVVDDHPLFQIGITSLLGTLERIEVVGSAASEAEAITVVLELEPDVVLMDLDLGGGSGIDATRAILRERPETAVLVLTMLGDDESLFASVRAGARGYLLKTAAPEEVERAVHSVAGGNMLLGAGVAKRAVSYLSGARSAGGRAFPELTERENEVLELIARGYDNSRIARTLVLTNKTVRNYVYGIISKLGMPDRSGLIVQAREAGFGVSEE